MKKDANVNYTVHYTKMISGHPVYSFMRNYERDLQKINGYKHVHQHPDYDSEAVFAVVQEQELEQIVPAICFVRKDYLRRITITGGYTHENFRKLGIYTKLYQNIVAIAERDNYTSISRSTKPNNLAMNRLIQAQGGKIDYITYKQKLANYASNGIGNLSDAYELVDLQGLK
jgi:ribosomal protein S18 acetylase RimI-like enzyme